MSLCKSQYAVHDEDEYPLRIGLKGGLPRVEWVETQLYKSTDVTGRVCSLYAHLMDTSEESRTYSS
jgi:hypothetical protein